MNFEGSVGARWKGKSNQGPCEYTRKVLTNGWFCAKTWIPPVIQQIHIIPKVMLHLKFTFSPFTPSM